MGESSMQFDWTEEYEGHQFTPATRKKKARRLEFVGWGSKPLIEFLGSIGVETAREIPPFDVTKIVNRYVNENGLRDPKRKKRVVCDDRLSPLFGRKSIGRNKISDLLAPHFAENKDDDNLFGGSEDEEDNDGAHAGCSNSSRKVTEEKVVEARKSDFAAIVPENIRRICLKRSLVLNLLKDPETFEGKIVGSLVRIKADRNDYLQKNSHLLVQVTGLRKATGTDSESVDILLQVSNFIRDVPISSLSDDNFTEDECADLHQRVKDSLLRKPTIAEFEEKVQVLHKDITNHWIKGELSLLQKQIDRANEKGWRKELSEYLDRRELLQSPAEQTKLLCEVPRVIAEEIEVKPTSPEFPVITELGNQRSPTSTLAGASEFPVCVAATARSSETLIPFNTDSKEESRDPQPVADEKSDNKHPQVVADWQVIDLSDDTLVTEHQKLPVETTGKSSGSPVNVEDKKGDKNHSQAAANMQIIDLSDDEEDEDTNYYQIPDYDPESLMWHYLDPQGEEQGPFSITALQRWQKDDYFPSDFKVWKTGQSKRDAVLLSDILHRI